MRYLNLNDEFNSTIDLIDLRSIQTRNKLDHSGSFDRELHLIIFYWANGGKLAVNYPKIDDRDSDHRLITTLLESVNIQDKA